MNLICMMNYPISLANSIQFLKENIKISIYEMPKQGGGGGCQDPDWWNIGPILSSKWFIVLIPIETDLMINA